MNRMYPLLALAATLLFSCSDKSPYPGYSKSSEGFYYNLQKLGNSDKQVQAGDYITADISYHTMEDSAFFQGRRTVKVTQPSYPGSVDACFLMLSKGEKASFIIPAGPFFKKTLETNLPGFLNDRDSMKMQVDLLEVQREKEFRRQKEAFLNWIEDFGEYERVLLQRFLDQKRIDAKPTPSGLYHIVLEEGQGPGVQEGDTVVVHYEGKFLNGKFFDSTKQRKQPFEFVYGHEMQVIKGMEEVIGKMYEGEKALAILPSEVAFGKTGSSTGIVPPYTSVVYKVSLLEVRKKTTGEEE
ncbi:MAG: FKBP-type peptidyl-prolyl cis-trans isomerase [Bacteroidales bacterium]|nr:FKBP-type peptidyl-prolyl cis-trans isomerase [Bacteroidales bacterium]